MIFNFRGENVPLDSQIMWTGDKVISKYITMASLQDINDVLKRRVVIWDNEHANDYDQVLRCYEFSLFQA